MTVFLKESFRCPELDGVFVAENEFVSASCGVSKSGISGVRWPRDFFVMRKGDQIVASEPVDEGGSVTLRSVEVGAMLRFIAGCLINLSD